MKLYVVETLRANGEFMADHGHFALHDALDEAYDMHEDDLCCVFNTPDDDYMGPCPGGCEKRSPRVVEYEACRSTSTDV